MLSISNFKDDAKPLKPCLNSPQQGTLISGVCHACTTPQPRLPWTIGTCPPCFKCGHRFCNECTVLLYQAYRKCWSCENESAISNIPGYSGPEKRNCRKCGFSVDASCELVWKEERRIGQWKVIYREKVVDV